MRKILPWIRVNNSLVPKDTASITVLDDGFQYGYGFFTTLKVREGTPLFVERHIDRLEKSAQQLFVEVQNFELLHMSIRDVIAKNAITEGAIRITITKGIAKKPTVAIHATTIDSEVAAVRVITVPDERDAYKTIKMTYRIPHMMAMMKAQQKSAQDALFTCNGAIIESTYANVYSFIDNHIVTSPIENKGLNGISRQILLERLAIAEREIPESTGDPMVLVSSLSIRVVETINGKQLKQNPSFISTIQSAIIAAENEYINAKKNNL